MGKSKSELYSPVKGLIVISSTHCPIPTCPSIDLGEDEDTVPEYSPEVTNKSQSQVVVERTEKSALFKELESSEQRGKELLQEGKKLDDSQTRKRSEKAGQITQVATKG